jgi:hypothetical protein
MQGPQILFDVNPRGRQDRVDGDTKGNVHAGAKVVNYVAVDAESHSNLTPLGAHPPAPQRA